MSDRVPCSETDDDRRDSVKRTEYLCDVCHVLVRDRNGKVVRPYVGVILGNEKDGVTEFTSTGTNDCNADFHFCKPCVLGITDIVSLVWEFNE